MVESRVRAAMGGGGMHRVLLLGLIYILVVSLSSAAMFGQPMSMFSSLTPIIRYLKKIHTKRVNTQMIGSDY